MRSLILSRSSSLSAEEELLTSSHRVQMRKDLFGRCVATEWVVLSQCVRYICRLMHAKCSSHTWKRGWVRGGRTPERKQENKEHRDQQIFLLLINKSASDNTKLVNTNIKRASFPLPMRNEIFAERAEATFFSKLDASAGIWQNLLSTGLQICT